MLPELLEITISKDRNHSICLSVQLIVTFWRNIECHNAEYHYADPQDAE
jgi:hypothetical protein